MKKETSSAKTPLKPKDNEKKASAKKKPDNNPETPAITDVEVTCQTSEQMTNHAPDQSVRTAGTVGLLDCRGCKTSDSQQLPD